MIEYVNIMGDLIIQDTIYIYIRLHDWIQAYHFRNNIEGLFWGKYTLKHKTYIWIKWTRMGKHVFYLKEEANNE